MRIHGEATYLLLLLLIIFLIGKHSQEKLENDQGK